MQFGYCRLARLARAETRGRMRSGYPHISGHEASIVEKRTAWLWRLSIENRVFGIKIPMCAGYICRFDDDDDVNLHLSHTSIFWNLCLWADTWQCMMRNGRQ